MALIKCRECGRDLSTEAAACPNCGAPNKPTSPPPAPPSKSTSPWTILGWIILILVAITFYGCVKREMERQQASSGGATSSTSGPSGLTAKVISNNCVESGGRTRATVVVQNTGSTEIPFARMFLTYVGDHSESTYGSPSTIPPGSNSEFMFIRSNGAASGCQIDQLQDGSGNAVALQR